MRARRWISINTGCCIFIHYISLKRYFIFLPIRHSFISFCFLQVANNSICIFLCQLTCLILSLASHLMLIFEAPTWNYRPVGASKTRKFTTPCVVNKKIVIHLLQMMIKSKQPFEISALYESIYIYIYFCGCNISSVTPLALCSCFRADAHVIQTLNDRRIYIFMFFTSYSVIISANETRGTGWWPQFTYACVYK